MEVYIKKYSWVLTALVVVICAVLAAKTVNNVIAAKYLSNVEPPPPTTPVVAATTTKTVRNKAAEPVAKRNMFCHTCTPPEPEVGSVEADPSGGVPITSLPLRLVATNVSTVEKNSFATVENTGSNKRGYYAEGDEIPDAGKVVSIRGRFLDFRNESSKRLERVELLAANKPKTVAKKFTAAKKTKSSKAGLAKEIDEGVEKTGDTTWEIQGSLVAKILENPAALGRSARIVPSIKNGKPNGFKLYAIRPNSAFAKIGLKNGDAIQAVNGFDLTSMDAAFEVYNKVKDANNLSLQILRRGKPVTHSYTVKR